jgi:hypothetical protein
MGEVSYKILGNLEGIRCKVIYYKEICEFLVHKKVSSCPFHIAEYFPRRKLQPICFQTALQSPPLKKEDAVHRSTVSGNNSFNGRGL